MRRQADPWLLFFRRTPTDLANRPGLASSLQALESSLFLIALMRYPHALAACVFAIENALKPANALSPQDRKLHRLIAQAQEEFPSLREFSIERLNEARRLRNHIVHRGFDQSDDIPASAALLSAGLPFLFAIHSALFSFDSCDSLVPPFGMQTTAAIEVFATNPKMDAPSALSVLGHLTRWSFRESFMAPWELDVLDPSENYDAQLEAVLRLRERANRKFDPAWTLDCPVCGGDTLVAQLDDELLNKAIVEFCACYCVECGLRLGPGARPLLNAVCRESIAGSREAILEEYGLD